jgi:hypothetical protein
MRITRRQLGRIIREEAARLQEAPRKQAPKKNPPRRAVKDPVQVAVAAAQGAAESCIDELLNEDSVIQFLDYEGDEVLSRSGVTPEQVEAVREEAIDALMEALKPALREKFAPFIDNLFYLL